MRKPLAFAAAVAALVISGLLAPIHVPPARAASGVGHVVVIFLENHTFDNVLGLLCVQDHRCNGVSTGTLADGRTIKLMKATDVIPDVGHSLSAQTTAIAGGKMNGFSKIKYCTANASPPYRCYSQFDGTQIPNLWRLARAFAISDATFADGPIASWGSHLDLVAQTRDGFTGDNPADRAGSGPGWGCDSAKDAPWQAAPDALIQQQPSCVPWYGLNPTRYPFGGAYRATPVRHVPTLMDRMSKANVSWKIYETTTTWTKSTAGGYGWAICPTFADCIDTSQKSRMAPSDQVISDAKAGTLPAVSLVMPSAKNSQHNTWSMAQGDAWLGSVVSAIANGPNWSSTTIFITYDDCGCFYDHVRPPAGLGIRVPMVIVGPYVRPHYTDHTTASYSSIDKYIEDTFGLPPLTAADANAYGYGDSFDYSQTPTPPAPMIRTPVPPASLREIASHAPVPDKT